MRGEVRAIAKVAVEEAVAPLVKEVRDLTSALDRERRERAEGDARAAAQAATAQAAAALAKKTTLPGVADAPPTASLVAAALPPTPPPPSVVASTPAPSVVAELMTTPTAPRVMPSKPPLPLAARAPDLVIDSSPLVVDLPPGLDGARRRKRNAWLVAFLLLAIVGALLVSTMISQSQPR